MARLRIKFFLGFYKMSARTERAQKFFLLIMEGSWSY